jgi:hypothetical protein
MGGSGTNAVGSLPGDVWRIRRIVQKHYDCLFEKMLRNEKKLPKGVQPLSYRPRVFIRRPEHIEEVLVEVEDFLKKHLPMVNIPPRPKELGMWQS